MDLINPIDREEFKKVFLTKEPFPYFCIDNFLENKFAEDIYNSFPSYTEAKQLGREFSAVNEKRKIQITDSSKFPSAVKKLHDLLSSEEYLDMWSDLTGIPNLLADPKLKGGGIHESNTGGHLDVHVDFNYVKGNESHRRLNILIYFNKDWKEEYGGYLDLWDKEVKTRHGYFEPKFNRAVGFLTSDISYHGVTPLTCPPEVTRKSFATYYYTKEAPIGWDGKVNSTVFRPRPDEWAKGNILMPCDKTLKKIKGLLNKFRVKIKR